MALLGPGHPGWIALSASGRAAVLTSPTSRYPHGVVGDEIEAASLTIPMPDGQVEGIAVIAEPVVIEGISPMRADLDGDGVEEVIVTLSDDDVGARIAGYHTDGTLAAEGPPIGLGSRWRHEIGAAPTGPDGGMEVMVVRTPHIDGIAEFYRMVGNDLEIEATVDGVTSHVIGSRNLDLALLADGDGDGAVELVAPAQDLRSLAGIGRTDDGAAIEWVIDLGGAITTNVTAATHDGALWFAVGIDDRVRMWPGA